jgi:hypothetical protein
VIIPGFRGDFAGGQHPIRSGGTKFLPPHWIPRGRFPPFNTAPIADSQRSVRPAVQQRALARIAKGGGLILLQASRAIVDIETPQPGMAERARDTATNVSRTITELSAALQAAVDQLNRTIATARRSEPLSTVSAIAREAPLASLFVAFLLGVAVMRRR